MKRKFEMYNAETNTESLNLIILNHDDLFYFMSIQGTICFRKTKILSFKMHLLHMKFFKNCHQAQVLVYGQSQSNLKNSFKELKNDQS